MSMRSWIHQLFARSITRTIHKAPRRVRPALESLEDRIAPAVDFGDAPDLGLGTSSGNYQTLLADNGPRHTVVTGIQLGANVDGEADASPNTAATGDDTLNALPKDEDGLVNAVADLKLTIGAAPTVNVYVTNTTANAATLHGWIDINGDGVFDNATERASTTVSAGSTSVIKTLTFSVVSGTFTGTTYARFRLSTDAAAANPTGAATDGEIEDYVATIVMPSLEHADPAKTKKIATGINGGPTLQGADGFGGSVAALGDLDGDGVTDLAVGVPSDDTGGGINAQHGAVYVLFMNADGTAKDSVKIANGTGGGPVLASGAFGLSMASLGDLDGDGVTDLAVGAPFDDTGGRNHGVVYVLFLNANGTAKSSVKIASGTNGGPTLADDNFFGISVASLGDLDGDGVIDLAVGALGEDSGALDRGAVYVLFMNSDGTAKSSVKIDNGSNGGPALATTDAFGRSVAALGDLDGDGVTDLAVGAFGDDTGGGFEARFGAVYVLFMNRDGTAKSHVKIHSETNGGPTLAEGDHFGTSMASLGDLDGDGVADLAVGAEGDDTGVGDGGALHVLLMNADGTVKSSSKIASGTNGGPTLSGGGIGTSVALLGDLDGDGWADLGLGSPGDDTVALNTGSLYVLFLNPSSPDIVSFTRQTPNADSTNADTLVFRATFDEAVQNVDEADFAVNGTTTATVSNVATADAGAGLLWDVTVSGGDLATFNGVVGLDLSGTQNITDSVGNTLPTTEPATDQTYTLENIAPVLSSFTRQTPSVSLTSADTLVFRATFDEAVQNVDEADFAVNGTTTATVSNVTTADAGAGLLWDVTVSGGDLANFNGVVGLNLSGTQNITDLSGNALPTIEPTTDQTYTLENNVPALSSFTRQTPSANPTNADTLVFRATFDEAVTGIDTGDFAVNGTTTATVSNVTTADAGAGLLWDVTVSGGDLANFNGVVGLNLSGTQNITDLSGNALPTIEPTTDQTYTLENNVPALSSFTRQTPSTSPTNADTLVFRATFDEAVQNVDAADFAVNDTTTATVSNVATVDGGAGLLWDVTVSGGDLVDFNGVVGLNLSGTQNIADLVGNTLPTTEPATDQTFTVENMRFTTLAVTSSNVPSTYGDVVTFTATVTSTAKPTGSVNFAIDSGVPVTGNVGTTTATTATWTFSTSSLTAGTHTVQASYVGSGIFVNSNGTLSGGQIVNKANATIVVAPYSVTYDGKPHTATVTSITGVNGETGVTVGRVDVSNTTHTNAGTYPGDSWSFVGGPNYNDIASTPITNVIAKAKLTIAADDDAKTYGTSKTFSSTAFTQTGLVTAHGDTITSVIETSNGSSVSASVGTYAIVPSGATGTGLSNYTIEYVPGTLRVTPATLTVIADSDPSTTAQDGFTKVLGSADPTLTYRVSGLQSGDTAEGVLTGGLTRTEGETVGSYTVTQGTLSADANYAIDFAPGTFTIGQVFSVVGADAGGTPRVRVFNHDGSLRFDFLAFTPGFTGGVRVALGDLNGDHTPDIIVAAGPGGGPHIRIFDGTDLSILDEFFFTPGSTFTGGLFVASGDVNGDGFADIIAAADAGGTPHVRVFGGSGFGILGEFFAYDPNFAGGVTVAAGDVNGDGFDDIITGAGAGGSPHVKVVDALFANHRQDSGQIHEEALLAQFFTYDPNFTGGVFLASDDVNGDGLDDILTGAGAKGGPHVKLIDAKQADHRESNGVIADAALLANFFAYEPPFLAPEFVPDPLFQGGVRVALKDYDGDGIVDITTAPGAGALLPVKVRDSTTLSVTDSFFAFEGFAGGVFVGT